MPQQLHFAADSRGGRVSPTDLLEPKMSMWKRLSLHKLGNWLKKEEVESSASSTGNMQEHSQEKQESRPSFTKRRPSRRVVPGLPRPLTFKRQESERRDRLMPHEPCAEEKRASSVDRRSARTAKRSLSPPPVSLPSLSAPDVLEKHFDAPLISIQEPEPPIDAPDEPPVLPSADQEKFPEPEEPEEPPPPGPPPPLPPISDVPYHDDLDQGEGIDERVLQQELAAKWILNLSMHFRDMSDREKFFVTYAEEPNKWRKVTVSCDYRDAPPDSLEADLKSLHYQRDKSARIYESIRDSLPAIQFYNTVTNLKLQTDDGRLHVHVTEDVNEIIPYPSISAVDHISCPKYRESAVRFDSHISGFVYKVIIDNKIYIKKEIPSPDTVEEFLYELNALYNLQTSKSVIRFEGIIVDETSELIKGLLISFADQGALVDLIYDFKGTSHLSWHRRERWAKQIVQGLSEIHECGYVQGDFTLSNIVIDASDNAKIIDINRRGCPVGWEPPELSKLIHSGQRVSIYIGVKSDLFQLGMVLWALAEEQDEPERQEQPLTFTSASTDIPAYFRKLVDICLDNDPRKRLSAKELLVRFPETDPGAARPLILSRHSVSAHRSDKEYIDPSLAVGREDIYQYRRRHPSGYHSELSIGEITYADAAPSTEYQFGSSGSYIVPTRGRSPASQRRRQYDSPLTVPFSTRSLDDSELENDPIDLPSRREPRWEQVYVDGDTRLIQRGSLEHETFDAAMQMQMQERVSNHERTPSFDAEIVVQQEQKLRDAVGGGAAILADPEDSQLSDETVRLRSPAAEQEMMAGMPLTRTVSNDTTNGRARVPASEPPLVHSLPLKMPEIQTALPQQLPQAQQHQNPSFSDRVQTRQARDSALAELADEIEREAHADDRIASDGEWARRPPHTDSGFHADVDKHVPPTRAESFKFGPPAHMDSGFDEPDHHFTRQSTGLEGIQEDSKEGIAAVVVDATEDKVAGKSTPVSMRQGDVGKHRIDEQERRFDPTMPRFMPEKVPALEISAKAEEKTMPVKERLEKKQEEVKAQEQQEPRFDPTMPHFMPEKAIPA